MHKHNQTTHLILIHDISCKFCQFIYCDRALTSLSAGGVHANLLCRKWSFLLASYSFPLTMDYEDCEIPDRGHHLVLKLSNVEIQVL